MEKQPSYDQWRDIVDQTPTENDVYSQHSLNDYIDFIRATYQDLSNDFESLTEQAAASVLFSLQNEIDLYSIATEPLEQVYVAGNGVYYPEDTDTVEFFDGTTGISGNFVELTIQQLPSYQDLIDSSSGHQQTYQLCLVLEGYSKCSDTGIALEPSGASALVPLEGQDLCFSRHELPIEPVKPII